VIEAASAADFARRRAYGSGAPESFHEQRSAGQSMCRLPHILTWIISLACGGAASPPAYSDHPLERKSLQAVP
jgi:hypothetical protein